MAEGSGIFYVHPAHRCVYVPQKKHSHLLYLYQGHRFSPQPFLVAAGNNKSYQKVAAEAFNKITGHPIEIHTVLKGSEEEASAYTLLKTAEAAPSPVTPQHPDPTPQKVEQNPYRPISREQISDKDRSDPSLNEALKIMADCDIYEKTNQ